MNRKHSPKHSPKDSHKHSPKHSSPRHSDTLAGAAAWEKGLRNAQASSPAAAGYRRSGKTSFAAQMSDLSQRCEAAPGAPHDTVPMGTDMNPPSSPENASEAAAEESARGAGSSGDGSRPSRGEP